MLAYMIISKNNAFMDSLKTWNRKSIQDKTYINMKIFMQLGGLTLNNFTLNQANILQELENYQEEKSCILTIGTFDGVHIGHQEIIHNLITKARKKNILAVVLTFFPHPRMVLQKDSSIRLIDTLEEKQKILASLGIDILVIHPFSKE